MKNLLAMQEMQETQVRFLGWEDSLKEGMATHSQYSCLKNPMDRGVWQATYNPWGHKDLDTTEVTEHSRMLHNHPQTEPLKTTTSYNYTQFVRPGIGSGQAG